MSRGPPSGSRPRAPRARWRRVSAWRRAPLVVAEGSNPRLARMASRISPSLTTWPPPGAEASSTARRPQATLTRRYPRPTRRGALWSRLHEGGIVDEEHGRHHRRRVGVEALGLDQLPDVVGP